MSSIELKSANTTGMNTTSMETTNMNTTDMNTTDNTLQIVLRQNEMDESLTLDEGLKSDTFLSVFNDRAFFKKIISPLIDGESKKLKFKISRKECSFQIGKEVFQIEEPPYEAHYDQPESSLYYLSKNVKGWYNDKFELEFFQDNYTVTLDDDCKVFEYFHSAYLSEESNALFEKYSEKISDTCFSVLGQDIPVSTEEFFIHYIYHELIDYCPCDGSADLLNAALCILHNRIYESVSYK